jgi:quinol monooxygenase YgiN
MALAGLLAFIVGPQASAEAEPAVYVRLAVLDINVSELEAFKASAIEHVQGVAKAEPGLLALHVVAEKDNPSRVHVFEMYANQGAYRTHLESAHFRRFVAQTQDIIRERKLLDARPVHLGSQSSLPLEPLVRMAEIQITPSGLEKYKSAVSEEIADSIRLEPGVATIYSVALTEDPTQLRFFEIYADESAYQQHIASSHFKKYVDKTKGLITARQLYEMAPIVLYTKSH